MTCDDVFLSSDQRERRISSCAKNAISYIGIMRVYQQHPELTDWDVLDAVSALIRGDTLPIIPVP